MAFSVMLLTVRPAGVATVAVQALIDEYLHRCERFFLAATRALRTEEALLTAVANRRKQGASVLWIADPGGRTLTTEEFTERVRQVRDGGLRHLIIAVGPADGWSAGARKQADLRLSLGPMTLPHELAALVLAEQIYRASTILQGHPYHLGH